jgi:hypothetical protein
MARAPRVEGVVVATLPGERHDGLLTGRAVLRVTRNGFARAALGARVALSHETAAAKAPISQRLQARLELLA